MKFQVAKKEQTTKIQIQYWDSYKFRAENKFVSAKRIKLPA